MSRKNRTSVNRRRLLQFAGSAAGVALAGCTGGDGPEEDGDDQQVGDGDDGGGDGDDGSDESVQRGGTLRVAIESTFRGFDPHRTATAHSWAAIYNVCETLLTFEDGQLAGRLAEDWSVSDDGTEYTFTLRDAKFHPPVDRELVAEDVVYSFERMIENETIMASDLSVVESVEATGEKEVTFTLASVFGPFLAFLVPVPRVVVPEEAVEEQGGGLGDLQEPVGTGPFRFGEYQSGERLRLDAFDDYHREEYPYVDAVEYVVMKDGESRVLALRNGDVDVARQVAGKDAETLEGGQDTKINRQEYARGGGLFINNSEPPWDDPAVRRAIAHLIDRPAVTEAGLFGFAEAATQPFSPNSFWHVEDPENVRTRDVEAAERILAEAGNPLEGETLSIQTENDVLLNKSVGTVLEQNLSEAGIDVELDVVDHSTLVSDFVDGSYGASTFSLPQKVDPDRYFWNFMHPDPPQYFHYGEDQPDADRIYELIVEGREEPDNDRRKEIYAELLGLVNEHAPFIPVAFQHYVVGARASVQGYESWLLPFNRLWKVWKES
jgi:peptide/nickel transport system substrate-binding protein